MLKTYELTDRTSGGTGGQGPHRRRRSSDTCSTGRCNQQGLVSLDSASISTPSAAGYPGS